jgi:hypothetical protein
LFWLSVLGFHIKLKMIKLQKVKKCYATRRGEGGGSAAVSQNVTWERGV